MSLKIEAYTTGQDALGDPVSRHEQSEGPVPFDVYQDHFIKMFAQQAEVAGPPESGTEPPFPRALSLVPPVAISFTDYIKYLLFLQGVINFVAEVADDQPGETSTSPESPLAVTIAGKPRYLSVNVRTA